MEERSTSKPSGQVLTMVAVGREGREASGRASEAQCVDCPKAPISLDGALAMKMRCLNGSLAIVFVRKGRSGGEGATRHPLKRTIHLLPSLSIIPNAGVGSMNLAYSVAPPTLVIT